MYSKQKNIFLNIKYIFMVIRDVKHKKKSIQYSFKQYKLSLIDEHLKIHCR